jgi:eukaryotic-like serine/threonine-protein kinase
MNCDTELLWTLVQQEADPGIEAEPIARHVEACSRCQQALAEMGGDPDWWQEAQTWLSSDESIVPHDPLPPIDLSFLQPASHPEMLGRIGRYEVEAVLGRGGMGVVLRAYDTDLHRSVAVKVMAPEWAASFPARQRFAREAQAAASVAHENVIPIYDVEPEASLPYLVMRYIPGMTLQRWVGIHGAPDVATILRVASQLAEGLAAAHRRGLVHRDIKPANVLVGKNIDRIWITDFGLARAADSVTLTRTGVIAGTPHYMSPEQARGEPIDHRSDLFSLGCVLYFLSVGRPPFDAENTLAVLHKIVSQDAIPLASLRHDLPPSFVNLVHQLLARKAVKRQQDCAEVSEQLQRSQAELQSGVAAKPPLSSLTRRILIGSLIGCGLIAAPYFFSPKLPQAESTAQDSGDQLILNPFQTASALTEPVTPYIREASAQIEQISSMDDVQFQNAINELSNRLRHASESLRTGDVPITTMESEEWQHKVRSLQRLINHER